MVNVISLNQGRAVELNVDCWRMNILFYLIRYPGVGGIESVTRLVAEQLYASYGVNVTILSFLQQGDCVCRFATILEMPNSREWCAKENYDFADRVIAEGNFDYVVYQDSYAIIQDVIFKAAKKHNVRVLVFEHNTPLYVLKNAISHPLFSWHGMKSRLALPYRIVQSVLRKRHLLRNCHKYVLLSSRFIPEFCRFAFAWKFRDKIAYINNPVKIKEVNVAEKENVILCVAQLAYRKRVDLMLKAWAKIYSRLPEWKLQIVGDGVERNRLKKFVMEKKIPGVEFVGYANPDAYYQRAKIFWMTSSYEGWGMTLVECMQNECVPVVFDSFSSLRDIVDNGKNGFVVKNLDERDFIGKTIAIADDELLRRRMAKKAAEKARLFDVKVITEKWTELLEIK
jgi:glycosyltransferase involved in cell wall biosynthesis